MKKVICLVVAFVLVAFTMAFGQMTKTGDISTDVKVKNVTTTAGFLGKADVNVGGVEVGKGAQTGDISTKVRADNITTTAGFLGKADVNVGGVSVGK